VISLGYFCSTALELQRYGLRDASYPLDWNITPLQSALAAIESGFHGFLQLDHLVPEPHRVLDSGSGIFLYNDFDPMLPIGDQYEMVRNRYVRRIQRFQEAIRQPTLFVRYIDTESRERQGAEVEPTLNLDEFTYLHENMAVILAVLRRNNPQNDLLLIGNAGLPARCGGLPVYTVVPDEGDWVARKFLKKNQALKRKLLMLPYPLSLRLANLLRYWLRSWSGWLRQHVALRSRLRRLAASMGRADLTASEQRSVPPQGTSDRSGLQVPAAAVLDPLAGPAAHMGVDSGIRVHKQGNSLGE